MSLASDALALSASVLVNPVIAGETVTFRGASVDAHVSRDVGEGTEPGGEVKTSTAGAVSIEFLSEVTEPAPGEIITTAASERCRIETVQYLGFGWRCMCQVKR